MFPAIGGHQCHQFFTVFLNGFLAHSFDFSQINKIVGQADGKLDQYPLVENLEMGNILLPGFFCTPVFQILKQLRVANVSFTVDLGTAFFSFAGVKSISAAETTPR